MGAKESGLKSFVYEGLVWICGLCYEGILFSLFLVGFLVCSELSMYQSYILSSFVSFVWVTRRCFLWVDIFHIQQPLGKEKIVAIILFPSGYEFISSLSCTTMNVLISDLKTSMYDAQQSV